MEAAQNKELQAKLRKMEGRAERGITECVQGLQTGLRLTGKERALNNLSAAAMTALADERNMLQPILQKHTEDQRALQQEWDRAWEKYVQHLGVGIAVIEQAVGIAVQEVGHQGRQALYEGNDWGEG